MTATTNDETPQPGVVRALAAVMEEVRGVGKDGYHDAPGAKFKFRGIDAVVNAVGPALRKHHVVVTPQLVSVDRRDVQTSGGKASRETCVVVRYVWTGPDGSTLESVVPGEAMDSGDKGTAKAMSVAFRIALLQALCLPTDDADPDTHQYEREAPARQQRPAQGQQQNGQRTPRPARAEQPAEPQQDGGEQDAMRDLLAFVDGRGWDRGAFAERYKAQYKQPIQEAPTVRLRAFLTLAQGWQPDELPTAAVAAANGAPQ